MSRKKPRRNLNELRNRSRIIIILVIVFFAFLIFSMIKIINKTNSVNTDNSGIDSNMILELDSSISKLEALEIEKKKDRLDCEKLRKIPDKRICYSKLGIKYNDSNVCRGTDEDSMSGCLGAIYYLRGDIPALCRNNACYMGYGYSSQEITICNSIDNNEGKDSCLYGIALKLQDASLCDGTIFKDNCYWYFAQSLKNASYCEDAGFEKEDCYFRFIVSDSGIKGITKEVCDGVPVEHRSFCYALEEKDPSLCELTEEFKKDCYSRIASSLNNPELCELTSDYRDYCLWSIAVNQGNDSLCSIMSGRKDVCYSDVALKNKDVNLCESAGTLKDSCIFNVMLSLDIDQDVCINLANPDQCYFTLAQDNEEIMLCDKSERYKEYCYSLVAKKTINSSLCYESGIHKDICFMEIAVENQMLDLCSESIYKNECIYDVVKKSASPELIPNHICEEAEGFVELCYYELGIKKNDVSLCLKAGQYESDCLNKKVIIPDDDGYIPESMRTNIEDELIIPIGDSES